MDRVLVVASSAGFWRSEDCRTRFPNVLLTEAKAASDTELDQLFQLALGEIRTRNIKVVVLGSTSGLIERFTTYKSRGSLGKIHIIADHQHITDGELEQVDANLVYSRGEIDSYPDRQRDRFSFAFFPTHHPRYISSDLIKSDEYVFAGDTKMRDFKALVSTMQGLDTTLKIVTGNRLPTLPENCKSLGRQSAGDYLRLMAGSRFVAVPLMEGRETHGHCDLSHARSMGKAVITTSNASCDDYVEHEKSGLMVLPGDVDGYRTAINRFLTDEELLGDIERHNRQDGARLRCRTKGPTMRDHVRCVTKGPTMRLPRCVDQGSDDASLRCRTKGPTMRVFPVFPTRFSPVFPIRFSDQGSSDSRLETPFFRPRVV